MVELVTGTAGKNHVSSADFGSYNAGIIGEGAYILPRGKRLSCEKVSDNLVKVNDGDMVFKGRHIRIEPEDYEELTIENGASGTKRHDLICIRVEKNEDTQIETASFVVVKGEFADSPVDPEYTKGTILENDYLVDEYPICRVVLNGLQIKSVTMLISEISSISKLLEHMRNLDDRKADKASTNNAINELEDKKANATETNAAISELINSVSSLTVSKAEQTAVEALSASVNELSESKATQVELDALEDTVKGKAEQTELKALSDRVDNLASLGEDATEGNLELLDIRTGADGTVYSSAGEAVRTQFKNMDAKLDEVDKQIENLTETATTTDTTLNGSKASIAKINAVRGKSEQKSFTGKQLLNASGLNEITD
ncbi:MAG: hypothetical protein J6A75_07110, partial [Lachnospiraceae bacterium]|nr:hypothetical protein [Lachnospiraceae bacterium]